MNLPTRKSDNILSIVNNSLIDLPAPLNLSLMWNLGSMLGLCLSVQIITGILLAMHYSSHIDLAFNSISHITREVSMGWMMRNIHANGASMFFMCLYLHVARGLYFGSFKSVKTWMIGVTIFILSMATAFMGYLLPWGQMSFWGATVITNLFSALPYIGKSVVEWLWGGFGVNNATLTRFFTIHFILPFAIGALSGVHLLFLHTTGSNNPLGINSNTMKTPFHPHYSSKDLLGFVALISLLMSLSFFYPNYLSDPENFIPANSLVTPTHIKPEWYFLWAYAILRSIPNKLGGVVAMFSAILLLYLLPMSESTRQSSSFSLTNQMMMWSMGLIVSLLTWIGASPVEPPYESVGLILTMLYFLNFMLILNKK